MLQNCPNCEEALDLNLSIKCNKCGKNFSLKGLNYFEVLNIPIGYEIVLDVLNNKYLEQQIRYHPDKFLNKSLDDKKSSETNTSILNNAYEVLKDPLKRIEYILFLNGLSLDEYNVKTSDNTLMQIMQWQDELEMCDSTESIETLKNAIIIDFNITLKKVQSFLSKNMWDKAASLLIDLKYMNKFLNNIENYKPIFNN